jgi:hypothetical protein
MKVKDLKRKLEKKKRKRLLLLEQLRTRKIESSEGLDKLKTLESEILSLIKKIEEKPFDEYEVTDKSISEEHEVLLQDFIESIEAKIMVIRQLYGVDEPEASKRELTELLGLINENIKIQGDEINRLSKVHKDYNDHKDISVGKSLLKSTSSSISSSTSKKIYVKRRNKEKSEIDKWNDKLDKLILLESKKEKRALEQKEKMEAKRIFRRKKENFQKISGSYVKKKNNKKSIEMPF